MRDAARGLVPADVRGPVAVVVGLAAVLVSAMCLRYRGRDSASWIDGTVAAPLEGLGDRRRWVLERLVDLGDPLPAAVLIVVLALVALAVRGGRACLLALLAPAVAVAVSHLVLKPLVGRTDEDGLVFPSTHATVVAAIAGVTALLALDLRRPVGRAWRRLVVVTAFGAVVTAKAVVLAAAGYHYFTDGVGGALLAVAVVGVVAFALDAVAGRSAATRERGGDRVRRGLDVVAALVLSVVLAPVALAVALAVLVTSGRPVIFRQRRSGRHGHEFSIAKVRTLRPQRWPGEPDAARRTRLGEFLRWSSLDEIPQLWNILRGEMGFIGPRPTLPEQVARYDDRQRGRLAVRPGITGWAQVNGRNALSWPDRIELDLWYVEHRSAALDVRILLRTVVVLLRPAGVLGEGGINPDFPPRDESSLAPTPVPSPRDGVDAPTMPLGRV